MQTYVLAGGCFWCLDAAYRALRGVESVVSGYTGGDVADPTYELVCTGATGHAEAVAVTFDPDAIPSEVILDAFFTMHDPRQLNHQGADRGTQYRSAMFPADADQRRAFEAARERASMLWDAPLGTTEGSIVTTIEPTRPVLRRRGLPPGLLRQEPDAGVLPGRCGSQGEQGQGVVLGVPRRLSLRSRCRRPSQALDIVVRSPQRPAALVRLALSARRWVLTPSRAQRKDRA